MNCLGSVLYDPAAAVTKSTAALLAMTALDATNLRITFTVPPSGRVLVRIFGGAIHGATTYPMILVGVLEGATVRARVVPQVTQNGTPVASTQGGVYAEFVVSGLTPGASLSWDLAYGVEVVVAATGWKYGGPNNATTNDAFGGIAFSIWDACPIYATTAVPTIQLDVRVNTIDDFIDTEVAAIKAKTDQLTFTTANKVDSTIQAAADFAQGAADKVWLTAARSLTDKSGFGIDAASVNAIWDELTTEARVANSYGQLLKDNLNATVGSRSTLTGAQAAAAVWDELTATARAVGSYGQLLKDRIDAAISSRLASGNVTVGGYAAGQSPDEQVLFTPGRKLLADVNGRVTVGTFVAGAFQAGSIDAVSLAADAGTEIADALLTRDMSAVTEGAGRTPLQALRALRNRWTRSSSAYSVYKEDDLTLSWSSSLTSSALDAVSESNP